MTPHPFAYKIRNPRGGGTSRKIGWGMQHASWNPYPISDQICDFFLPYFRPDPKFDMYSSAKLMIPNRKWPPKMDRKWSSTPSDPQSRPQMIPWKLEEWNGFYGTDYKKGLIIIRNLFLSPSKEKGKEDVKSLVNLYRAKKKWNKSEKDMVSIVYVLLCQFLQFSFENVSSLKI